MDAAVDNVSAVAPDGRCGIRLALRAACTTESADALRRFAVGWLGRAAPDVEAPSRGFWWMPFTEDAEAPRLPAQPQSARTATPKKAAPTPAATGSRGPPPRVAGQRVGQPAAEALATGLPPTTLERLRGYFASIGKARVGIYLNTPCAYNAAGAQYWGRALRLNDRWLQINTNSVLPGLSTRLRCDLTVELDGTRRPVSIHGIMARKLDPPPGSTWKGGLAVRIQSIDEGESPGLLIRFLEVHLASKSNQEKK